MASRKVEIAAGFFFILVLLIAGVALFQWGRDVGLFKKRTYTLHCYVAKIAGLKAGMPVIFRGKTIGQVREIHLNRIAIEEEQRRRKGVVSDDEDAALKEFEGERNRFDQKKRSFQIDLEIEREFQPFIMTNSKASMTATTSLIGGLVGGGLDLSLGTEGKILQDDDIIDADNPKDFEDIATELSKKLQPTVEKANQILGEAGKALQGMQQEITGITQGTSERGLGSIVRSIDILLKDVSQGELNQKIKTLLDRLQVVLSNTGDLLERDRTRRSELAVEIIRREVEALRTEMAAEPGLSENTATASASLEALLAQKNNPLEAVKAGKPLTPAEQEALDKLTLAFKEAKAARTAELARNERVASRLKKIEEAMVMANREVGGLDEGNVPALLRQIGGMIGDTRSLLNTMELDRRVPRLLDLVDQNLENAADLTGALKKHWLLSSYIRQRPVDPEPHFIAGHAAPY